MHPNFHRSIKKIYSLIPFKQELFKAIKKVWSPPEYIYKHLHFKGIIKVKVDSTHSFRMKHYGYQIENEVFWSGLNGNWEKQSINLWRRLCTNSNIVFDIGANTGVYSLITKALKPTSSVYAFEPVKRVFEKLLENNDLNNYDITCLELAVSDYDGEGFFLDSDSEHTYSVTINKLVPTRLIETKIQTITLDTFIKNNSLPAVDLVKIDVETHEAEVMAGFNNGLCEFKPTILIEILNEEVGKNVHTIVKYLGYLYFHIDEENGLQRTDSLTPKHPHYNFLLCSRTVAEKLNLSVE